MPAIARVILVLWVVFWIFWFAAAVGVKPGRTRLRTFAGGRVAILIVVFLLLQSKVFRGHTVTKDPWLEGIGFAVFISGLALAVWARLYLGRNWGSPMSEKVDPELVTTGPYRKVRHPIYSGILVAMVGTAAAVSWYWLIAVVLAGVYFVYSATVEERYLTEQLPDIYPAYKHSTKMLLPFIF